MRKPNRHLMICLNNEGHEVSLEKRKIYIALVDTEATKHALVRVVDESGEDYLYPREFFSPVELPPSIRRAVLLAA